jgi:hypothetical protein
MAGTGGDLSPERPVESLGALRRWPSDGRPAELGELEVTITPPPDFDADVARLSADLGVHRLGRRHARRQDLSARTRSRSVRS